eukprot:381382_1
METIPPLLRIIFAKLREKQCTCTDLAMHLLSDPHSGNINVHSDHHRNVHTMQTEGEDHGNCFKQYSLETKLQKTMKSQSNAYEFSGNQEVMSDTTFSLCIRSGTKCRDQTFVPSTSFMIHI